MEASDFELIKEIQRTPALYDTANPDFKFTQRKELIWKEVASYLGINVLDLKRRWTCLRDRYTRELKQQRIDKESFVPTKYFERMDFLRKFVRKRRERKSIVCNIKTSNSPTHHSNEITYWEAPERKETDKDFLKAENFHKEEETVNTEEDAGVDNLEELIELQEIGEGYETYEDVADESKSVQTVTLKSTGKLATKRRLDDSMCENEMITLTPSSHRLDQSMGAGSQEPETPEDYFCKSLVGHLKTMSRVNKIKTQREIFQIIEKYVELDEAAAAAAKSRRSSDATIQ